jgi:N-acetylmuramoyl-L-alanine amidase
VSLQAVFAAVRTVAMSSLTASDKRRWRLLALLALPWLAFTLAQDQFSLAVGNRTVAVAFAGGVPYGPAEPIAQALGLGFSASRTGVYVSLGGRVEWFPYANSATEAGSTGKAWRREAEPWLPLRGLATALDLEYRQVGSIYVLGLRPARLLSVRKSSGSDPSRLVLSFDRDVQVRLIEQNPPTLALIGVVEASDSGGLELSPAAYGLRLTLPAISAPLRLSYSANAVVLEWGQGRFSPRVVLDPGHGGGDSGVVVGGVQEKDVALNLARRLAENLQRRQLSVTLTRPDDRNPSLRERASRATFAQVFVSLHAASGKNVTLYTYPDERGLAFVDKGRQLLPRTPGPRRDVLGRFVAEPDASLRLSRELAGALASRALVPLEAQGPYFVLSQAAGAAVLLEVGMDEASDPEQRAKIVDALTEAILKYLGIPLEEPRTQPLNNSSPTGGSTR